MGGLATLFAWSVRVGLAALVLIALWVAWLVGRDALGRRRLRRRCRALVDKALAGDGLAPGAVFHSHLGIAAFGIAVEGRKLAYASPEGVDVYDFDAIFEASAARLPQGDFKIGISVPGRVTGKPYWHELIVSHRRDAVRWVETLKPCLGTRLKADPDWGNS